MSSLQTYRIAICGGGIGGLTLAAFMGTLHSNHQIDIYEAAENFTTIGAGIAIWRRTYHIFKKLGLDDALYKLAVPPSGGEQKRGYMLRYGHQKEPSSNFFEVIIPSGAISLHRANMLKFLTELLPKNSKVHFGKKLHSYEETSAGKMSLLFTDGTLAETDLLVGADGFKSATRASMYLREAEKVVHEGRERLLQHVEPKFSGTHAYRALVPSEVLRRIFPLHQSLSMATIYLGRDQHVTTYPISQGKLINVVAYYTDYGCEGTELLEPSVVEADKEEILDCFHDWEPEVRELLSCIQKSSRWAIMNVPNLPFFVSGRAVLLGDSAHAMAPFSGAGANEAIQDAYILSKILTHPNVSVVNISAALKVYESVRLSASQTSMEETKLSGYVFELRHPTHIFSVRDNGLSLEQLQNLGREIYNLWRWHWETSGDEDWKKTEELLRLLKVERDL